jgi:hypothetical protein
MIKFFRRIRQQLLTDNNFSKYLLYAIGEIILVVIGILIALQINNWNEERVEHREEKAILEQLKTEFSANLSQLDDKIRLKNDLIYAVTKIFQYIDQPSLRNKDSLDQLLGNTIPYSTFDPIVSDLASSGSLRLIRSDSLKLLLSLWTSDVVSVQEDELAWKTYRDNFYVPFLVDHYQLRTIRQVAIESGLIKGYLIETGDRKADELDADIGNSKYPTDHNALLDQPDFEDHLERAISTNRFALSQSLILRNRILEIIALLNRELSNP